MLKNEKSIDKKIAAYIDNVFAGVGSSQQLFDLKEELISNLKEKTADYQARGMDEEQAFKEAVISLGDLSGLVDDLRRQGQDEARKMAYSTMTAKVSTAGIVAGTMLILFGIFTVLMLYFMGLPGESVTGSGIFIVIGGTILTYSILTRETRSRFAMNKIRAVFYSLAVLLILFGIFSGFVSHYATGQIFIGIGALMVFFIGGAGLMVLLLLTGTDRRKRV